MRLVTVFCVALGAAALSGDAAFATTSGTVKEGGTFNVAVPSGRVDTIDPALVDFDPEARVLQPACGSLVAYPERPLPAGLRLVPELAEGNPVVSGDGLTYTFTVREDARFSDGAPVTAQAFAHALERILTPTMKSPYPEEFQQIVGAREMLAGKATTLAGADARGRTLTLRLTKRVPDFLERIAELCAVPPSLPAAAEGARAPLPSAAPYYVAEYVPGERIVLERNTFYRGSRSHHVDRFVVDVNVDLGPGIDGVAKGTYDTFVPGPAAEQTGQLVRRYGINKSQLFVVPGNALRTFVINTSRPLFRNNVKLRQAVNFAVDRRALVREAGPSGETPSDQFLLPWMPGYTDARIYPLQGPDLRKARALARGRTRGGKVVLYTIDFPSDVARAQILKRNLKAIGLQLEIKVFPVTTYFDKVAAPGEPYDLARLNFGNLTGPTYLGELFDYPPKYRRLLDQASRLAGNAQFRAYGRLDVQLSRDFAPAIPVSVVNAISFVSARVGCVVLDPYLDLTAVCLN